MIVPFGNIVARYSFTFSVLPASRRIGFFDGSFSRDVLNVVQVFIRAADFHGE